MKNVLYIGNNLKSKSTNISSIQALGSQLEQEGYTMYYASSISNKVLRLLDMIWMVVKCSRKIDYVIIDTYSTLNFYYAILISQLCRLLKLKYITNLNGGNLPARLINNQKLSALLFKNAHYNVSPSDYLNDAFYSFGFTKVRYIPNTIILKNYKFRKKDYDPIRLLWVRSFSRIYNPILAIEVIKQLELEGYKASLCMVGPDSDGTLKEVKKLVKLNKLNVKFTGKLPKSEWITLAEDYNIFINTTNFDNTPVSVIEAMALGLTIVSTNVGGMPYLIENNEEGLLVEPNDAKAMAKAIINLFKNPDSAKRMSLNARQKVEQFDWEVVKHRWLDILE